MEGERRGWIIQLMTRTNPQGEESMDSTKPFSISKQVVWKAYQQGKATHGAAGVDGEAIAAFDARLKDNLYKLWNRWASGSYFPPPVKVVAGSTKLFLCSKLELILFLFRIALCRKEGASRRLHGFSELFPTPREDCFRRDAFERLFDDGCRRAGDDCA